MSDAPEGPSTDAPEPEAQRPRRRRWAKAAIIAGTVLALLAVVGGVSAYLLYDKLGQITVIQAPTTARSDDTPDEPVNLLLMGSDSRSGKGNSKYGLDAGRGGQRSDTTILLHISGDRSRALAVSIPRDLWVEQPKCARKEGQYAYFDKFNNAFDVGGPPCTTELVSSMTGVAIHHIAVVDFQGFKQVVDALGGVEVCLNNAISDPAAKLDLPAGKSVVSGEDALAFVRARKYIGDGSDIGRIERQQAFLSSAIRKATDTGMLLNPAKLYSVVDTATKALTVDQSLDGLSQMTDLALSARNITPEKVTFTTMPFVYRADGANVDPDTAKAASLWRAMIDDTPWPAPPSVGPDGKKLTVAPADIWVDVRAPGKKLANVSASLQTAGFGVGDQSSASVRGRTRVVYPPAQKDSARTVAFAAGAKLVKDSGAFSVRLEVGKDYQGIDDSIVVAKEKKRGSGGEGGKVTKADEVTCAG